MVATIESGLRLTSGDRYLARALAELAIARGAMGEAQEAAALRQRGTALIDAGSERPGDSWPGLGGWNADVYHALARAAVHAGDHESGLDLLAQAIYAGWRDVNWLENDTLFAAVRDTHRFRALAADLAQAPPLVFQPL